MNNFKPGDIVENRHAGEDNPLRVGVVLCRTGKSWKLTNFKGDIWDSPIENDGLQKISELDLTVI